MTSKRKIALNKHNLETGCNDTYESLSEKLLNHHLKGLYIRKMSQTAAALAEDNFDKEV